MRPLAIAVFVGSFLTPAAALAQVEPIAQIDEEGGDDEQIIEPRETVPVAHFDPEIDVAYPRRSHFAMRLTAAATVRALHGSALAGAEGEAAFGGETRGGSFYGALRMAGGATEFGLTFGHFSVGPVLEWPIGIVRIGFKPRVGYLWINRVTADDPMDALTLGGSAHVSVDVFHADGISLALGIEPVAEVLLQTPALFDYDRDPAALLGANAFLSFRMRTPKRRK